MLGEVLLAIVFPPGNGISGLSSSEHVHITVTVNICCINTASAFEITCYSMLGEVLFPVIFPPGNVIGISSGSEHVHIAVTVNIFSINRSCKAEIIINDMFRPFNLPSNSGSGETDLNFPIIWIVADNGNHAAEFTRFFRRKRDFYIDLLVGLKGEFAVEVDVKIFAFNGDIGYGEVVIPPVKDVKGGFSGVSDIYFFKIYGKGIDFDVGDGWVEVALPPVNIIGVVCCAKNILIAITIQIDGKNTERAFIIDPHRVSSEVLITVVFKPCDFSRVFSRSQNIDIPVIIHISSIHRTSAIEIACDCTFCKDLMSVILKPGDIVI